MYTKTLSSVVLLLAIFSRAQADIWDEAQALVEEVQVVVNRAQSTALTQTQSLSARITDHAQNISASSSATVEEGRSSVERQLDNLLVLAEVLNRGQCLDYRKEELQAVTDDLVHDIRDCVTWIRLEATSTIINVSAYISSAQSEVTVLRQKLEGCPREGEDVDCVIVIIGEMQLARDYLPTMVMDETLRVLLLARGWENDITTCADHRSGLIYSEGTRIITEVEECLTAPEKSDSSVDDNNLEDSVNN